MLKYLTIWYYVTKKEGDGEQEAADYRWLLIPEIWKQ